ncbi:MAG TPA: hypothetical protein VL325_08080 [Pyrinomonadaceae bacterium]|nr:hypothetical protein [Pyrinomonadaceae bacterium]
MKRREFLFLLSTLPFVRGALAYSPANYSKIVYPGKSGKMIYVPDENGNTIPDFSNCGYLGGGVKLPDVPVRAAVAVGQGDAGAAIQAAIDKVSAMAPDKSGFRGAVLVKKGIYKINEPLKITTGGVVLRGEGQDENGTVLVATQKKQHALIEIRGKSFGKPTGSARRVLNAYAPVGAHTLKLDSTKGLQVGDAIIVRRIGNKEWIHEIAMDRITPRPSGGTKQWEPFNMDFDRIVTAINGDEITINAPIVCAIEQKWGGGEVYRLDKSGRIQNVGVENLRGDSEFDQTVTAENGSEKKKYFSDEQHGWDFISISGAEDAWVRDITAVHYGYSAVNIGQAQRVTVQDSKCLDMVSQITGGRRYCFNIDGQQNLVQRCDADTGRHSFVVGGRVCGPNVFLHCKATTNYATSEPHHRWSVGGLYDSVAAPMAIQDRQYMGSGHGWAGANYVAWNCEGPLVCQRPPTAQNWAIGQIGEKQAGAFAPRPDGYWESQGRHVAPASLYLQQLEDRLGKAAVKNIGYS